MSALVNRVDVAEMMNMETMAAAGSAAIPVEREFQAWTADVSKRLGRELSDAERNGMAYDLFADGCDVDNAASEIKDSALLAAGFDTETKQRWPNALTPAQ